MPGAFDLVIRTSFRGGTVKSHRDLREEYTEPLVIFGPGVLAPRGLVTV
jgi:hypothetical protein